MRQADRLATVGRLSANMAHEIRNPARIDLGRRRGARQGSASRRRAEPARGDRPEGVGAAQPHRRIIPRVRAPRPAHPDRRQPRRDPRRGAAPDRAPIAAREPQDHPRVRGVAAGARRPPADAAGDLEPVSQRGAGHARRRRDARRRTALGEPSASRSRSGSPTPATGIADDGPAAHLRAVLLDQGGAAASAWPSSTASCRTTAASSRCAAGRATGRPSR